LEKARGKGGPLRLLSRRRNSRNDRRRTGGDEAPIREKVGGKEKRTRVSTNLKAWKMKEALRKKI